MVFQPFVITVTGKTLGENLDQWERSERRNRFRQLLRDLDGVEPDDVILPPERARERGLAGTLAFPRGNLAPDGSVVKATAIDPSVLDPDGVYRREGPARVFVREKDAMAAIKQGRIKAGDVMVLTGVGPMGTGMEETYQVTGALKHLPFGKHVALLTDARFSGLSTGACIGHIGPEGLILSSLVLRRPRRWIGCKLWEELGLRAFWEDALGAQRGEVPWAKVVELLAEQPPPRVYQDQLTDVWPT